MKKIITTILVLLLCNAAFSQAVIFDSVHCTYDELYTSVPVMSVVPTDIGLLSDDNYSNVFSIGFNFTYFGINYTRMIVGENGEICFDTALAGTYDPWPITARLLGNPSTKNCICGPWCDIDGAISSQPIYYTVYGTAPNRTMAITWCGVAMYDASRCPGQWTTTQIVLFEGTNNIEVHITHKTVCTAWNGGYAITGVEDSSGTVAVVAPGEDYPTTWSATAQSWRFTPAGTTYTVASIPYVPYVFAATAVYWYDSTTRAYLGTGDSIAVVPMGNTTYEAAVVGCNDTVYGYKTLQALIGAITGNKVICVGDTTHLADTSAGVWSSGNITVATINSVTGVVTGISPGVDTITIAVTRACGTILGTTLVYVQPHNAGVITGRDTVCVGGTTVLTDTSGGGLGAWTTGNGGIATVVGGVVVGVGVGTVAITYTDTNACGRLDTFMIMHVGLPPAIGAIHGNSVVCVGSVTTLIDSVSGGVWSAGLPPATVATVSSTGVVTGIGPGTVTITYATTNSCETRDTFFTITVTRLSAGVITGRDTVCTGATTTLVDTANGGIGVWTSSNGTIATVSGGIVTGVGSGNVMITYTDSSACGTKDTFVNVYVQLWPAIGAITGTPTVCVGGTTTLSDTTAGGVWSTGTPSVATVGPTGVVFGNNGGSTTITYAVTSSCGIKDTTFTITVGSIAVAGSITGASAICQGGVTTLSDTASGGVWSSGTPSVATISSSGAVTGINPGTVVLSYAQTTSCGTQFATFTLTVNPLPGPILGSRNICLGGTTTLTDSIGGGTWTTSNGAVATIGAITGYLNGLSIGTTFTTYTLPTGCKLTILDSVIANVKTITGIPSVCVGSSVTLSDSTLGGFWTSGSTGIATAGSSTGIITGVAAGTTNITYSLGTGCSVIRPETVIPRPVMNGITGTNSVCVGANVTLADATLGGTWTSNNTGVATVSATGIVTGIANGTAVITYALPTICGVIDTTLTITVNSIPATILGITGTTTVCVGATTTLADGTAGGVWSSSSSGIATINAGGVVTGVTGGVVAITYGITNGCGTKDTITTVIVTPLAPLNQITGTTTICLGSTVTLAEAAGGGTWSSSNTGVASVSPTGAVTGLTVGTATISYSVNNICGTRDTTALVTVTALPTGGTITGSPSVCTGATTTLADATGTAGGTWSSSSAGVATVSATGVVTGITVGTTNISYTVITSCGTVDTFVAVTVSASPVSGTITGSSVMCLGSLGTLTDTTAGGTGTWSSSNTTVATVGGGIVTTISAGTTTITYNVTNICGTANSTYVVTVQATPTAGTITGSNQVCLTASVTLSDLATGGVWSASNGNAVVSGAGVVFGVTAGTDSIIYTVANTCGTVVATFIMSVTPALAIAPISGSTIVCAGNTLSLSDITTGGTWISGNSAIATVNASGVVTGVAFGTVIITYQISGSCGASITTTTITVDPALVPGIINGSAFVCTGSTTTLTETSPGGSWSMSNADATISGGVVSGLIAGTDTVIYTVSSACGSATSSLPMAVISSAPPAAITGPTSVCVGNNISLTETSTGGTWSSSNISAATVNSSGVVTGVASGSTNILYSITSACGTFSVSFPVTVNPQPNAGSITGTTIICTGTNATLADAAGGGVWSSSAIGIASVNATGVVHGITPGIAVISYVVTNVCGSATATAVANINLTAAPGTITGPSAVCVGTNITLADTAAGGVWSSSSILIATVSPTGIVTGINVGSALITYGVTTSCGAGYATALISVGPAPFAGTITGINNVCMGSNTTLTDLTAGGVWSSSNPSIASVGPTGIVTGVAVGMVNIYYTVSGSCGTTDATVSVNVSLSPDAGTLAGGSSTICQGTTTSFTDTVSGGTWHSTNPAVATIGSSGLVTGLTPGTTTISYVVSTTCGTVAATQLVTVNPAPVPGFISGATSLCVGSGTLLLESVGGGAWSSGSPSVASVTGTGFVNGLSAGSVTISYSETNSCGTATATKTITVSDAPDAGVISGSTTVCTGTNITLSDAALGGVWSSSNPSLATVSAIAGGSVVSGIAPGSITISYVSTTGCGSLAATYSMTVNPSPVAGIISGSSNVCTGNTITLIDTTSGGVWSSSTPGIASVSGGVVTGVAFGTVFMAYAVTNSCGTAIASMTVSVGTAPATGVITGGTGVCEGIELTLSDLVSGGTWSSSNPAVASIGSTGIVTGVAPGSVTISYSILASCGLASATETVTVTGLPDAGVITGTPSTCIGTITALSESVSGGVWSSGIPTVATVDASGVVTGVNVGLVNIYYTVTNGCGSTNATIAVNVGVPPFAAAITGITTFCVGSVSTLADTAGGGVWSSADTTVARISSTGVVTGVTIGTDIISYTVINSCGIGLATADLTITSPGVDAGRIHGITSICTGTSSTLTDSTPGGAWHSADTAITRINAITGVVTGVTAGTATISYTVSTPCGMGTATTTVTITGTPSGGVISGSPDVCLGTSATLSDGVIGGFWGSSNPAVAIINSSGVVSGVSVGSTTISYTVITSCGSGYATYALAVTTTPYEGVIIGPTTICPSTTSSLTETVSGGTWSSGTPSVATVSSSGVVTGVTSGSDIITYTVINACGIALATADLTISPLPNTGVITGMASACLGSTSTLADTAGGGSGIWSSSNPATASISSSGVVTGNATGTAIISYGLTNACGTAYATVIYSVVTAPTTAGTITGPASVCSGSAITLTDGVAGGTWSSSNPGVASITAGGAVIGGTAGTATITYSITNACGSVHATFTETVSVMPYAGFITGTITTVCAGATITLADATPGGTWRSTNPAIADVSSSGVVTGYSGGSVTIFYVVINSCGTASATMPVTVRSAPTVAAITGPSSECPGTTITLSDATTGGVWNSSNPAISSISVSGVVTGNSGGTDIISYTVSDAFGCSTTVNAANIVMSAVSAGTITATTTDMCVGHSINLTDLASGGTWSSSNPAIASVSATGVVTGFTAGTVNITYAVSSGSCASETHTSVTVNPLPTLSAISGPTSMCSGSSISLLETTFGGTWSSSNGAISTVNSLGVVSGLSSGVDTITYSITNVFGCFASASYPDTVNIMPTAGSITATTTNMCAGSSIVLGDAAAGGVWSSSDATIATVSSTGVVSGVSAGTINISYSVIAGSCSASVNTAVTVYPASSVSAIVGATNLCVGSSATLSDGAVFGGTWSSSNPAVESVDAITGEIIANTPGVDTIYYTVTNIFGCSATAAITDTVNSVPSIAPITGTSVLCQGATTPLSEVTTGGVWSSSDITSATVDATGLVTGIAPGTPNIYYTVSSTSGCSNMVNLKITVNPLPGIGAIHGAGSICAGATATLTNDSTGGIWTSTDTTIASIDNTLGIIVGHTAGIDTFVYTVYNSYGCSISVSATETVNPTPVVAPIFGATSLCLGSITDLSDTTGGGTWSSSNPTIAGISFTGAVSGYSIGTVTIFYSYVNSFGCSVTVSMLETVVDIPSVAAINGATHVCTGAATMLTDGTTRGVWSSSDITIATVNTSGDISGVSAGIVTIYYTVTGLGGCTNFSTQVDTVIAAPIVATITGSSALCIGTVTTLNDATTGGIWSGSTPAVATISSGGVVTAIANGNDTIAYTVTNSAGCTASSGIVLTVDTLSGMVLPTGGGSICHGNPVDLTVSVTGTIADYQWFFNGIAIAGATSSSYSADTAGIYTADVTIGACNAMLTGTTVAPQPNPIVGLYPSDTLYTGLFATYQWLYDGGIIAGANSSTYIESTNGNYQVIVTDVYGCTDTSTVYTITTVGITNVQQGAINVKLYPNPTTAMINIEAPIKVNVSVSTIDGKVKMYEHDTNSIDLSGMANGVYLINVYDRNNALLLTSKVVKMD